MSGNDKKKCEAVMTRYLSLDKGARVPLSMSRHFMTCAQCQKSVAALRIAERMASAPLNIVSPVTEESLNEVLRKAGALNAKRAKMWPGRMTMPSWIIGGILMICSMLYFVTSTGGAKGGAGIALVFALVVTLYCVAFVTGNIDYFVKKTGIGLTAA